MPYEARGRVEQKRRTRHALVAAARELVARGVTPTVEAAAAEASVSRTTAYRYFPSQRALLLAAHPETGAASLLPADATDDVEARLDVVAGEFIRLIADTERQQRTMLRLSLDAEPSAAKTDLPLRKGRAIGWIAEALAPLQDELTAAQVHRLVLAIRATIGIEALIWLTDVAGLSRAEAADLMAWSARALLHAARTTDPPPPL